ncbi:MAG: lipopolysaccharide biosynthesis protein [Rhodobacteraceae bacterium]|nr:lipopolysaccharide biosynthesis protein [Paracoccaceae bacterium]
MAEVQALKAVEPEGGPSGVMQEPPKTSPLKNKRWGLILSFLCLFLIPVGLGGAYFGVLASDRYAAGASFVIRGLEGGGTPDFVTSFTGLSPSGSTTSDSYVVRNFLESADLLRQLDAELDLRGHYSQEHIDPIARFRPDSTFEELVEYWQWRINTTYDSTTGIVTFEVQAFDAEMAERLAQLALAAADRLVNELSEKARRDSVQFAAKEVERAEERVRNIRLQLVNFRAERGAVDPMVNAQLDAELMASLETKLVDIQARINALAGSVDADSPMLTQLNRQARALEDQIQQRRALIGQQGGQDSPENTAEALAAYEGLLIEQNFAQQSYASAMVSLETARMDADRQQRYLGVFARPFVPNEPAYPVRVRDFFLVMIAAFALWAISTLIAYTIRDHMR